MVPILSRDGSVEGYRTAHATKAAILERVGELAGTYKEVLTAKIILLHRETECFNAHKIGQIWPRR